MQHSGADGIVHVVCSEERGQVYTLLMLGPQASQGILLNCCFVGGLFSFFLELGGLYITLA